MGPNFKYKPHHVYHPADVGTGLHPVFSIHQLSISHPTFCLKNNNETDKTESASEVEKTKKPMKSSSSKVKDSDRHSSPTSSDISDSESIINKSSKSKKKSHRPRIAAATRKSAGSTSVKMQISTAFTSSEEGEDVVERTIVEKVDESNDKDEENNKEEEDIEEESSSNEEEKPIVKKVDVSMERLHKNIVEHKYGQYKKWLEKQKQLKLEKEEEAKLTREKKE